MTRTCDVTSLCLNFPTCHSGPSHLMALSGESNERGVSEPRHKKLLAKFKTEVVHAYQGQTLLWISELHPSLTLWGMFGVCLGKGVCSHSHFTEKTEAQGRKATNNPPERLVAGATQASSSQSPSGFLVQNHANSEKRQLQAPFY